MFFRKTRNSIAEFHKDLLNPTKEPSLKSYQSLVSIYLSIIFALTLAFCMVYDAMDGEMSMSLWDLGLCYLMVTCGSTMSTIPKVVTDLQMARAGKTAHLYDRIRARNEEEEKEEENLDGTDDFNLDDETLDDINLDKTKIPKRKKKR